MLPFAGEAVGNRPEQRGEGVLQIRLLPSRTGPGPPIALRLAAGLIGDPDAVVKKYRPVMEFLTRRFIKALVPPVIRIVGRSAAEIVAEIIVEAVVKAVVKTVSKVCTVLYIAESVKIRQAYLPFH